MPTANQYVLPKTKDSDEFEMMVKDCASRKWGKNFQLYGRKGQTQNGIDIYSEDWEIVIQCKNYSSINIQVSKLKAQILDDYHRATATYRNIKRFVAVTSYDRDAQIQDLTATELSTNTFNESIVMEILFWDDIQNIISNDQELMSLYYPNLLNVSKPKIYTANDQYVKSHTETLFMHKGRSDGRVNLVNLFLPQRYLEFFDNKSDGMNDLPQRISEFVRCDRPFLFIEGNAGSGKSSLVGWINYHASLNDAEAKAILGQRPLVTVRLRDLNRDLIRSEGSLIKAILSYMHIDTVDALVDSFPNAIMILDGFDELCIIENFNEYERLLYDLYSRKISGFKFIITVRPKYVEHAIDIPHSGITLLHFNKAQREEWLHRYTAPEYCGQHIDPVIQEYIRQIDDWTDSAICDTPMTLYMLAAKTTSVDMIRNSWQLYRHIFYNELSETEYNEMFRDPDRSYAHGVMRYREIIYHISEEIAYRMYRSKNNKFYLSSNELKEIIVELCGQYPEHQLPSWKAMIQRCYALCTYWKADSDDGAIEFYHNNIRDFFLCEKIVREMDTTYQKLRQEEIQRSVLVQHLAEKLRDMFQYNSLETMVCQFLLLRAMDICDHKRVEFPSIEMKEAILPELFEVMLLNGTMYHNLNVQNPIQAIINILTCTAQVYRHVYEPFLIPGTYIKWWKDPQKVNESGVLQYVFRPIFSGVPVTLSEDSMLTMASKGDFSKIDFGKSDLRNIGFQQANVSNANLSDTILTGCDFESADLSGSDFTNADIHYASLKGADLRNCKFTGALLSGTDLPDGSCSENQEVQFERLKKFNINC